LPSVLEKRKTVIERKTISFISISKDLLGLKPFVRSKSAIQSAIIPK
jgi:hypothetical protein